MEDCKLCHIPKEGRFSRNHFSLSIFYLRYWAKLRTATFSICFNFSFVRWASCIFSYISSNKFFCNSVDKQTQKQRDKQIQIKETKRHKTKRQTDTKRSDKQTNRQTTSHTNRQTNKHTYQQTTDNYTNRQTTSHTNRQLDWQTCQKSKRFHKVIIIFYCLAVTYLLTYIQVYKLWIHLLYGGNCHHVLGALAL